jgi:Domain of unknown function (DUF4836)
MKKQPGLGFVAIYILFSTIANGQSVSNPLFSHLPAAADHIYEINFSALAAKANLGSILNNLPPSKNAQTAMMFDLLKNPAAAGVDFSNNIFITQTAASGSDTLSFINVLFQLSDSAKFRATLASAIGGLRFHRLPGKGTTAGKDKMGLAWNDRLAVITLASRLDSTSPRHFPSSAVRHSISEVAIERSLAALAGFTGSPFTTDHRFLAGFASEADFHSWSNGRSNGTQKWMKMFSKLSSKRPNTPGMNGIKMPDGFFPAGNKQTPVLSTLNFAEGRMVFQTTSFLQADDATVLNKVIDKPFNKDLLAHLPSGPLLGWAGLHINLGAIGDVLEHYHIRSKVDSILAAKGFTLDDFTAVLGGDFLFAAFAPEPVSTTDTVSSTDTLSKTDTAKKRINFYFVATLGDPAQLMKLAAKLSVFKDSTMTMRDSSKSKFFKDLGSKFIVRNNLLVISNSRELALKYFTHSDLRPTDQAGDDDNGQSIVVDLKATGAYLGTGPSNIPQVKMASHLLERLDRLTISAKLEGNNKLTTIQLITNEPSTNSLSTLMSILH